MQRSRRSPLGRAGACVRATSLSTRFGPVARGPAPGAPGAVRGRCKSAPHANPPCGATGPRASTTARRRPTLLGARPSSQRYVLLPRLWLGRAYTRFTASVAILRIVGTYVCARMRARAAQSASINALHVLLTRFPSGCFSTGHQRPDFTPVARHGGHRGPYGTFRFCRLRGRWSGAATTYPTHGTTTARPS